MLKKLMLVVILTMMAIQAEDHLYFNGGIDFNYARYTIGNLASQSGYLAGPHFDFQFKKPWRPYVGLNFDGRWNAGLICSSITSCPNDPCISGSGLQANVADYIADFEMGYFFVSGGGECTAKLYSGAGFYNLSYEINPDTIRYKYYQIYIPLGLELLYHSERSFSIGTQIEYRAGVYNRLRVLTPCLTDDCNSLCDEKIKLNYSQGFHAEIPVIGSFRNDKRVGFYLSLSPFFDWNKFASTCDTNSQCIQFPIPENKRWYLGVMGNIGISF